MYSSLRSSSSTQSESGARCVLSGEFVVLLLLVPRWHSHGLLQETRVFSAHNVLQKQSFDYKYMCFETDFLEMLTLKEEAGMVFWFRVR